VPASERQALFAKKLHLCSYTFDFNDTAKHAREKEIKRQTLLELVEYVNTGQGKFTEALFDDIAFMLANNLFRALPPSGHETTGVGGGEAFDAEEEEPALEPAWSHLQARV
jgi:serine/threonine-protein phosphatase 2A regulatory subunit B'